MAFDLRLVPFSRRGSYFAISHLQGRGYATPEGLYLRSVHGGADHSKELFSVEVSRDGRQLVVTESAQPDRLELSVAGGRVEICIARPTRILIRGQGADVALRWAGALPGSGVIVPLDADRWLCLCNDANLSLLVTRLAGELAVDAPWTGVGSQNISIHASARDDTAWIFAVDEVSSSWTGPQPYEDFDDSVAGAAADFNSWLERSPHVDAEFAAAAELAAYVNWSSEVHELGLIKRPSMLMSKNWMTSIWTWDPCINAMALTGDIPRACDQFLTMFDHQDANGALPDAFSDRSETFTYCKPPVHGWALGWLMKTTSIPTDFLAQVYDPLARLTNWWLTCRDHDGDGYPQYNHGNDSGCDNATVFRDFVPVESPDLLAYLVLQMETLATIADVLGRSPESLTWKSRADALLDGMIRDFWRADHFIARNAITHEPCAGDSLVLSLPLVLGHRLPPDVFNRLADDLIAKGFTTEHGLATESVTSPFYEADGYWRGPIWAPTTLLIVDGLADGGRTDLASQIARNFCETVKASGMAENFDAISGEGLRDRSYTLTASAFLVLASRYVDG